jgi:tRNA pseudouridine32 synthase/23S rRNA pseudouridine746 synthase
MQAGRTACAPRVARRVASCLSLSHQGGAPVRRSARPCHAQRRLIDPSATSAAQHRGALAISNPPSLLPPSPYAPPQGPLRILFHDASVLVVDKPPGLLTVPGKSEGADDCLIARLGRTDAHVRLVHRLDRDTSGVMIFARTAQAQRHLGRQFERRYVAKTYVALVLGRPASAGRIDLPLAADWPRRPRQMVCFATGRQARTRWRVLPDRPGQPAGTTRVALAPETGRSHQLRVHMAELGHPILGDPIYGDRVEGLPDMVRADPPRLMLHSERLALRHPHGGAHVEFLAPAPF